MEQRQAEAFIDAQRMDIKQLTFELQDMAEEYAERAAGKTDEEAALSDLVREALILRIVNALKEGSLK